LADGILGIIEVWHLGLQFYYGSHHKKIGVLMGGLSSEREVSLASGGAILLALKEKGYHAVAIDVDRDVAETIQAHGVEAAFIALHGRYGEDGAIQGMLEVMGIPYTGSGILARVLSA
jgi:D-alanine-D-alanine ligase